MAASFEPLETAPERILTLKVTLLLALTSLNRAGDLQAHSVSPMCMDFAPVLVKVTLRPRPAMSPRFYPHRFALKWSRFTPFILLPLLQVRMRGFTCSVLSELWRYMRKSPQLLVCFGAGRRGLATSKQNLSQGEGRYFTGLWVAWPSFNSVFGRTLQERAFL